MLVERTRRPSWRQEDKSRSVLAATPSTTEAKARTVCRLSRLWTSIKGNRGSQRQIAKAYLQECQPRAAVRLYSKIRLNRVSTILTSWSNRVNITRVKFKISTPREPNHRARIFKAQVIDSIRLVPRNIDRIRKYKGPKRSLEIQEFTKRRMPTL